MINTKETTLKIKRLMLAQNEKSTGYVVGMGNIPRYRGDDGNACGIGCVIPDDIYNPLMEGLELKELFEKFPKVAEHFRNVDILMLYRAQHMHDDLDVGEWPDFLDGMVQQHAA